MSTYGATPPAYPVRIEGELQAGLSRWLWLVKWLLAIPHFFLLFFLWVTLFVLTVVAFFAILFTGRYPRGIFDFNLGVLRWTWRVGFYTYSALGTDRYPPFTLDDVPDYPARLEVAYPERLSRGLVLVKWWLLAIPHYIVVGIFLGGTGYAATRVYPWFWGVAYQFGLIGFLVFIAAVALLFTTRYPAGLFDFVLGLDRWVARVAAYVLLMRDEYPPFRLDAGGTDPGSAFTEAASVEEPPPAETATSAAAPARRGWSGGRILLVVVGVIAGLFAFGLLTGGCALVVVDQTQRDSDGFLMSPTREFASPTYAIVSERAKIDKHGGERALDFFLGDVRIRSKSVKPVFVGIGPAAAVERYLGGVERDVVHDFGSHGHPRYSRRPGREPSARPESQTFWVAAARGSGEQTLRWNPEAGNWQAVLMSADASRGVASQMSIGAKLESVLWIGIGMLVLGALLAAGSGLAITAGLRQRGG
jgi:hypothetical protein